MAHCMKLLLLEMITIISQMQEANNTLKTLNIYATGTNPGHTVKWVAIVTTREGSQ
jgi:hypothetical protein